MLEIAIYWRKINPQFQLSMRIGAEVFGEPIYTQ